MSKSAPDGQGVQTAHAQVAVLWTLGAETALTATGEVWHAFLGAQIVWTAIARKRCYTAMQATHTIAACIYASSGLQLVHYVAASGSS